MASAATARAGQEALTPSSKCAFLSLLLHSGSEDADTAPGAMSSLALGPGSTGSQSQSPSQRSSEERESGVPLHRKLGHIRNTSPETNGSAKRLRLEAIGDPWAHHSLALEHNTPSPAAPSPALPPALEHANSISLSPGEALLLPNPSFSEAEHPSRPQQELQAQPRAQQEALFQRSPLLRMDTGLSESVGAAPALGPASSPGLNRGEGKHLSLSSESLAHPGHALGAHLSLPEASKRRVGEGGAKRSPGLVPGEEQGDPWLCDLGLTLPNPTRELTPPAPDTGLMVPTPGVYQREGPPSVPVQAPVQSAGQGGTASKPPMPAGSSPLKPSRNGGEQRESEREKEKKKPKIQDLVLFWLRAQKGLKGAQPQGLGKSAEGQGQGLGQIMKSGVNAKALEDLERMVLKSQSKVALQERVDCNAPAPAVGAAASGVKREDQPSSSVESGGAGSGSAAHGQAPAPALSPALASLAQGGNGVPRIAPRGLQAAPGARESLVQAHLDSPSLAGPALYGGPLRTGLERAGSGAGPEGGQQAWGEDVSSHHKGGQHLPREDSLREDSLRDCNDIKARSKVEKKRRERISHAFAGLREVVNVHGDMACVLAKATSLIKEQQEVIGGLREQLLIQKLKAGVHPSLDA